MRNRAFSETPDANTAPDGSPVEADDNALPEHLQITEKQVALIHKLLDEKDLLKSATFAAALEASDKSYEEYVQFIKDSVSNRQLTQKRRGSQIIESLIALPNKARQTTHTPMPDVPEGHYAITVQDGSTSFVKVVRPTQGKWAGRTFVNRLKADGGFGDDFAEIRIPFKDQLAILEQILEVGVQESMERYGKEIGRCGHCRRNLTDEVSIARGIGPVCAGKMGWS